MVTCWCYNAANLSCEADLPKFNLHKFLVFDARHTACKSHWEQLSYPHLSFPELYRNAKVINWTKTYLIEFESPVVEHVDSSASLSE